MKPFIDQATEIHKDIIDMRRKLHSNPELSFKEYQTTQYIKQILDRLDIEIVDWGGETRVVGLLKGKAPGPVVALRADIDALPVLEENDCEYRSQNSGIMHACGHDVHTACLLGATMLLAECRDRIKGTIQFIFQPAEEINAGAKFMLSQGIFDNPVPAVIFGLHNSPNIPSGQVCLKVGQFPRCLTLSWRRVGLVGMGSRSQPAA